MKYLSILLLLALVACKQEEEIPVIVEETTEDYYFPPISGDEWESLAPESLEWDTVALNELFDFLESNDSRAFIVLHKGKIVVEQYWGNTILGTAPFDASALWYWASAAKTLKAFLVGIAQTEGLLSINDATSNYLGEGWTSLTTEQEAAILIKHQLCMTTGLDYSVDNPDCTAPACLQYGEPVATQWYYHNAPYTLLTNVIENASAMSLNEYTSQKVGDKIGMQGNWLYNGDHNIYWSTARDAARFGLLLLNKGSWEASQVLSDSLYYQQMTQPSQDLNPSYGYLTWLNGQSSIRYPGLPIAFNTSLATAAPDDLFTAMGKNGQFIGVVPSKDLVVVRMGDNSDAALVPTQLHNEMWAKISDVIE